MQSHIGAHFYIYLCRERLRLNAVVTSLLESTQPLARFPVPGESTTVRRTHYCNQITVPCNYIYIFPASLKHETSFKLWQFFNRKKNHSNNDQITRACFEFVYQIASVHTSGTLIKDTQDHSETYKIHWLVTETPHRFGSCKFIP